MPQMQEHTQLLCGSSEGSLAATSAAALAASCELHSGQPPLQPLRSSLRAGCASCGPQLYARWLHSPTTPLFSNQTPSGSRPPSSKQLRPLSAGMPQVQGETHSTEHSPGISVSPNTNSCPAFLFSLLWRIPVVQQHCVIASDVPCIHTDMEVLQTRLKLS